MLPRIISCLLFFGLLTHGCAQAISCTVTQKAGETCYRVPQFNGTECNYSWTNETNHVLATNADKTAYPVSNKSIMALTLKTCVEQIQYTRDCISEGNPRHVICVTNCSGNPGPFTNDKGIHRYHLFWIVILGVILGVAFCVVSCRKHCNLAKDVEAQHR